MPTAIIKPLQEGRKTGLEYVEQRLQPHEILDELVMDVIAYIHLTEFWVTEIPYQILRASDHVGKVRRDDGRWVDVHRSKYGDLLICPDNAGYAIQPGRRSRTRRMHEWLEGISMSLVRSEVAIDLLTARTHESFRVQRTLGRHVHLKWAGKNEPKHVVNGYYLARKGAAKGFAWYSDRGSRLITSPACHTELRFHGRGGRRFISSAGQLFKVDPQALYVRCINDKVVKLARRIPNTIIWPGELW